MSDVVYKAYMEYIYIVSADFEDFDSSVSHTIGVFGTAEEAEEIKNKWESFFKHSKEKIFSIPRDSNGEFESDDKEDEYYSLLSKYEPLHSYAGIGIEKRRFGVDEFSVQGDLRSRPMQAMIQQWERDYRINKIIE